MLRVCSCVYVVVVVTVVVVEKQQTPIFFVLLCNVGMCFERGFYITREIGYKGHCFTLAVEYKTLSINVQCSFFLHLISLFCFFWPLKMFSKRFHVAILFSEFNFVLLYCATLEHIVYYSQPTKPRMYSKKSISFHHNRICNINFCHTNCGNILIIFKVIALSLLTFNERLPFPAFYYLF